MKTYQTLEVTQAQIYPIKDGVRMRATARIVLNDQLQLTSLRIVNGTNGLFVCYPDDRSYKDNDYRSLFYPLTKELRDHIEKVLIDQYEKLMIEKNS